MNREALSTLFEMVTGKPPHERLDDSSIEEILERKMETYVFEAVRQGIAAGPEGGEILSPVLALLGFAHGGCGVSRLVALAAGMRLISESLAQGGEADPETIP